MYIIRSCHLYIFDHQKFQADVHFSCECVNIISQDHVKVREWKEIEIVKYWSSGISKVILSCNKIHVSLIKYRVL